MRIPPFLNHELFGNQLIQYIWVVLVILIGSMVRRVLSRLLSKVLFRLTKRYTAGVSEKELHQLLIQPLSVLLLLATLYVASGLLRYPLPPGSPADFEPWPLKLLLRGFSLGLIISVVWVVLRLVDFALLVVQRRTELNDTTGARRLDHQFLPFAKDLLKVFVIVLGVLVVLGEVFAVNVTALIGGLGIGGLAVAFAAKESLENLIASFTIFLDQPFGVGDLVKAGDVNGTVEKIGFRSTRLRTSEKSYLTVPNKSMIDKPLDNLSLRTSRRVGFTLTLSHTTSSDQLRAIINDSVLAIKEHPKITQDVQIKFNALTQAGKEVTVEYFVETSSYDEYLNVKEDLNFRLVEVVEQHGGEFANAAPAPAVPAGKA
jgi:MscS family membrane protein